VRDKEFGDNERDLFCSCIFLSWLYLINYLRFLESYRTLVEMIYSSLYEMLPFLSVLVLFWTSFATFFLYFSLYTQQRDGKEITSETYFLALASSFKDVVYTSFGDFQSE
jgi:hypothetical protein